MKLFEKLKQILIQEEEPRGEFNLGEASLYEKPSFTVDNNHQSKVDLLTPREKELFLLLLEGFTLKESAKQLSIKYSTANTHMTNIYKKLEVNSRAELIINYYKF